MNEIAIIFPHQLFEESPLLDLTCPFFLIEESLFFKQYPFHQQKIAFHRASMKFYESYLKSIGKEVTYIDAQAEKADIRHFIHGHSEILIHYIDPVDGWLNQRIQKSAEEKSISLQKYESPMFLTTSTEIEGLLGSQKKYFHHSFYQKQRKKLNLLLDEKGQPEGGKWSFDQDNRKKYPKKKVPPQITFPSKDVYREEAIDYVHQHFHENWGTLNPQIAYPHDFEQSKIWLEQFLEERFQEFGIYEDAIVKEASFLNHSILTPMLNVGLLTPDYIVQRVMEYSQSHDIPLNSVEGFIRQIIGWREFIRGLYVRIGRQERSKNFWQFKRKIPPSFWRGTTGIPPIDETIHKLHQSAYNHHIERLMVIGNFMFLCEFDPDEVYRWFMTFYIDAYDWVMVPNVYGMSQFADGGMMSTKPYISGSNYVVKMSNYSKGDWQQTWDALFWRFLHQHRDFFMKNPRMNMLIKKFDQWDPEKRNDYLVRAETYLKEL